MSRRIASGDGVNWALYSHVVLTYGLMLVSTELIPFTVQQRHRDNGEQADGGGGGRKRSLCKTTQFAYILSVLKSREIWRNSMAGWCLVRSVSRPRHVDCDDRQHHQDRDGRKPDRRPAVRHAGVHRRATRSTLSSGGAGGRRGQLPQGAQNSRVKIVYH